MIYPEPVTAFLQYAYSRRKDMNCVDEMLEVVINMPMSHTEVKQNCNFQHAIVTA